MRINAHGVEGRRIILVSPHQVRVRYPKSKPTMVRLCDNEVSGSDRSITMLDLKHGDSGGDEGEGEVEMGVKYG